MKRRTVLWIMACVGLLLVPTGVLGVGPPEGLDVNVLNTGVYQFAGFSSATTNGAAGGIGGMHALCQEFGSDARMCTTKELLLSPDVPVGDGVGAPAWVQPTIATTVESTHYDYSGSPFNVQWGTCYQWTSTAAATRGMVFSRTTGSLSASTSCGSDLPVVCCRPKN